MHFPIVTAFSVKEFCRRYNVSPATAYRIMKAGELAYRKVGRRRLIAIADAEAWWNSLPGPPGDISTFPVKASAPATRPDSHAVRAPDRKTISSKI